MGFMMRACFVFTASVVAGCSSDGNGPNGGDGLTGTSGGTFGSGGGPAGPGGTTSGSGGTATGSGGTSTSASGGAAPSGDSGNGGSGGTPAAADSASGGGAEASTREGGADAAEGASPVGDWGPGDYPPDINAQTYLEISGVKGQGTYVRQYKVHVPPGYDPRVPTPVVFCLHGLAQNAVMFCVTGAEFPKKADETGFVLVMPNGYSSSWNAGTCCGAASTEKLDDVALMRAILGEVQTHVNVDPRRVYASGLSNGGYMSYRLACDAADVFAAVAPGAAAIGINTIGGGTNPASDFTECNPSEPVSVLDIHGTADGLVPYSLQAPTLALVTSKDQCGTTTLPAQAPTSAGDTTCVSYSGCPAGVEVTACTIQGGGHCWFGSPDCGTGGGPIGAIVVGANSNTMMNTDAVFDFFARRTK